MNPTLFLKAIKLQDKLVEQGNTREAMYFEFDFKDKPILVSLKVEDNKSLISCTCLHGSINYEALCSHKLAVLFYLFKKELRRLRKKW